MKKNGKKYGNGDGKQNKKENLREDSLFFYQKRLEYNIEIGNIENENNIEISWRKLQKNIIDAAHEVEMKTININ